MTDLSKQRWNVAGNVLEYDGMPMAVCVGPNVALGLANSLDAMVQLQRLGRNFLETLAHYERLQSQMRDTKRLWTPDECERYQNSGDAVDDDESEILNLVISLYTESELPPSPANAFRPLPEPVEAAS